MVIDTFLTVLVIAQRLVNLPFVLRILGQIWHACSNCNCADT